MTRSLIACATATLAMAAVAAPVASAPQQQAVFGATVARVRVDVIVTDGEGRFVDDLRPQDFVLYEDGARQELVGFQLVDLGAGTVTDLASSIASRPGGESGHGAGEGDRAGGGDPSTAPDAKAPAVGAAESAPHEDLATVAPVSMVGDLGAMIFLIDLPGLNRQNKDRFAEAWQELLAQTQSLGIPRAVYMIDQVGNLEELAPLTRDVEALRGAARAVYDAPLVQGSTADRLVRVAVDVLSQETLGFLALDANDMNELRIIEAQERFRSRNTIELLTQFCDALSVRRGRTALVWVSSEILISESGPGSALMAAVMDRQRFETTTGANPARRTGNTAFSYRAPDREIGSMLRELHQAANSANVSIYTIDPTPSRERRIAGFDRRVRGPAVHDLLDSEIVQTSLDSLKDALWDAPAATRGKAFVGPTEINQVLEKIDHDVSRFYLLSYAPPPPQGDGEYHEIRVEVRRPGLQVRERNGYVDLPANDREGRAIAAALALPGAMTQLPVKAKAFHKWSATGVQILQLVVQVENGTDRPGANGDRLAPTPHQFHAVALDRNSTIVDEVNQRIRPIAALAPGSQTDEGSSLYIYEWSLPPGEYDIRVAVKDELADRMGATQLAVSVPEPPEKWHASDLMLMVTDGAREPQPLIDGRLVSGDWVLCYLEVFGGQHPVVAGDILTADGEQALAQLPDLALEKDGVGIHRGMHRIKKIPPGNYLLQIMVFDAAADQETTFRVPIEVLTSPAKSRPIRPPHN